MKMYLIPFTQEEVDDMFQRTGQDAFAEGPSVDGLKNGCSMFLSACEQLLYNKEPVRASFSSICLQQVPCGSSSMPTTLWCTAFYSPHLTVPCLSLSAESTALLYPSSPREKLQPTKGPPLSIWVEQTKGPQLLHVSRFSDPSPSSLPSCGCSPVVGFFLIYFPSSHANRSSLLYSKKAWHVHQP